MGVLNVTPDSFYDGGRYGDAEQAKAHIDALIRAGADCVDIGGESTRPGAQEISAQEQVRRIEAAVRYAVERGVLVSIDTTLPSVAEHMLALGAHLINDISCLSQPELARVCARFGAPLVLMHSRGPMSQQRGFSVYPEDGYGDVVEDVLTEWRSARDRAVALGLDRSAIYCDPGLGFGKSARQSLALLRGLARFKSENVPLVVGPSRKSFLAVAAGADVRALPAEGRLPATIAACLLAVERGASVLRVHDVGEVAQALQVARAVNLGLEAAHA